MPPTNPDEALTFLSVDEANEIRALVRTAFAERGIEVSVYVDHVADAAGRQFGLWNVAATCHQATSGRREWPDLVGLHVQRVLDGLDGPDPFEDLSADDVDAQTYTRLYDAASVPEIDRYPHRPFAPGLVEMIALDLPESVAVFSSEWAQAHGGVDNLRRRGAANLRAMPVEVHEELRLPNGARFHALAGDSVYTGSQALRMPQLAAEVAGEEAGRYGWLLCVPNRQQMAWRMVDDETVIATVQAMVAFASRGFTDSPGPLSPHVYWWDGASYQQLTQFSDDAVSIIVGPELQAALEALGSG